jgi:hypothetical protein
MNLRTLLTLSLAASAALQTAVRADDEAVAISAQKSPDYVRERQADGTYKPETYAFAKGGIWRSTEAATKDDADFMDVAHTVAYPLEAAGYVPTQDPNHTRLLIVVYWGTTTTANGPTQSVGSQSLQMANEAAMAANHPQIATFRGGDNWAPAQMAQSSTIGYAIRSPDQLDADAALSGALAQVSAENAERDHVDLTNARLLGYDRWWESTTEGRGTALEQRRQDLVNEIEAPRYFVVLMAYDFGKLYKEKQTKLLWETRFSVRERDGFSDHLAGMAQAARAYFGRSTATLVHAPLPEGHVNVGPLKELASDTSTKAP